MPTPRLAPLLFCLLLPLPGLAQDSTSQEQPAPRVTPPPLVPAPPPGAPAPSDSPQAFPGDPHEAPSGEPPEGEIIQRDWYAEPEAKPDPSPTLPRLLFEAVGGTVGATVGIIPGGLLIVSAFCTDGCSGDEESRAILGLGLALAGFTGGTALGITGAGALLHGEGEYWPTAGGAALGTLAGTLLALALASSLEEAALVPFFAGPVIGGMIAYEISHSNAIARRYRNPALTPMVMPMATVSPRGGVIGGLAGRF